MNPWIFLIVGLLIGWLVEWVIDWLYWRRRRTTVPVVQEKTVTVERERLEDIFGIGPTYAKRLRAAGFDSFEKLAEASKDDLEMVVKKQDWQVADPASWISQARDFAKRRRS
jgi:predicted flap endonuclease-1-like 5' DNA nuclease